MSPTAPRPRAASPANFHVIRLAILLGVLTFGAITWFLHRDGGFAPDPDVDLRTLLLAGYAVWAAAAVAEGLLQLRYRREASPARRAQLTIVGWAVAEAPALWGGVHYFVTDDPKWFFLGILFLLLAFLLFPVPRREG